MKIIITEEQQENLLSHFLNKLLKGHEVKFENEDRVVYLDGRPMIKLGPTKAVVDKEIMDEAGKIFYFETIKDFKDSIKKWIIDTFGVKEGGGPFYGITFKNLSNQK